MRALGCLAGPGGAACSAVPPPTPLPTLWPTHPPPAGILAEQVPAVVAAYSPWFDSFQTEGEDRWALVTAVRNGSGAPQQ